MKKIGTIILAVLLLLGTLQTDHMTVQAAVIMQEEPIVIVLDPGHGGTDNGAVRTWSGRKYREKDLNLAIAKYCKAELEQYAGVQVYLTRSSDTYVSLGRRVEFAKEAGADIFVSLHNNADYKASSRGASVYYPNAAYKKMLGESGREAASCIQRRLASLDLKNNGIAYRNSEDKTKYPDKRLADYYYVIRESKLRDMPGIIVEHAYVSNPTDCKTYLGSDAKLKKLGAADAAGIADYFGLVKGTKTELTSAEEQEDGSVVLAWTRAKGMDGYSVYRKKEGESVYMKLVTITDAETTNYVDNTLIEAGVYEYCVRAYVTGEGVGRYTEFSDAMQIVHIPALTAPAVELAETGGFSD